MWDETFGGVMLSVNSQSSTPFSSPSLEAIVYHPFSAQLLNLSMLNYDEV